MTDVEKVASLVDGFRATDTGNADRLVAAHGERLRYVPAWKRWLAWDGSRWRVDVDGVRVGELAKDVPRRLLSRIGEASSATRAHLLKHVDRTESAAGLNAMVALARTVPGVTVDHADLDALPWMMNVVNGTLDLRAGELLHHDPEQLLTQRAPVSFDPSADAPLFDRFLERIVPDPEVRSYLQRWTGYCLSGDTTEQALGIWWGAGRNGKSTLISILRALLGGYSAVVARDLLITQRFEQHPTALASLFRIRLATCVELPDGGQLDEARIKALTGGDTIQARRMREDLWEYEPTHKLVIATNHRPAARGDDFAFWRRVHLVPFTVTIDPGEVDRDLAARIIATELPGVLRWAVDGFTAWQASGLQPPEAVRAATDEYRAQADTVARFFDDIGLTFQPGMRVISSDLRKLHDAWCDEEGVPPTSHWKRTQERLKESGAEPSRNKAARFWTGAGIEEP